MSDFLRRCVALGPDGVINPGGPQDYANNRALLRETGTRWVRLWADWPSLQPENRPPDEGSGAWRVAELDRQIGQANADGIKVILCLYRCPRWANGTAGLSATEDAGYQLWDRISAGGDPARRKQLEFKVPADLSPTSAYGRWVNFLARRYSRNNRNRSAVVSFIDVCNEPNAQMWPLQGPSTTSDPYGPGALVIQHSVAQMFKTAATATAAYGGEPMLMGPGSADRVGDSRTSIGYDTFGRALLDALASGGFAPGSGFAWSHHNFTDVEYDQGSGSTLGRTTNRAARMRELLRTRWAGWPNADAANPSLLVTEGGARLEKMASVWGSSDPGVARAKQSELIRRNWDRMITNTEGAGIGMVAQYLFRTDINYDCGLCDLDWTRRPAYTTWGALPVFDEATASATTTQPSKPPKKGGR
jgi:hypothetical protein